MRLSLGLATLAALLLVVPAAEGRIIVNKSIMKIELGMKRQEVRALKGEPDGQRQLDNEILGKFTEFRYGKTRVGIAKNSGVFYIRTRSKFQRTPEGVGVGTPKRKFRRKMKGETCKREFGRFHCWFGVLEPGQPVTDFSFRKGRVRHVLLGTVID